MTYAEFISEFEIAHPSIAQSKMFGMACIKLNGKAVLGDWEGGVVFKLDPKDVEGALEIPCAHLFDPMGGRPMKQWVVVPSDQSVVWADLGAMALDYASSQAK